MPVAPERTNPYDPAFEGTRLVNAPDSIGLIDATPTSVTVAWSDVSSFESGYRVEGPGFDPVDLPPNTTSYRLEGLLDAGQRTLTVRTLGDGGGTSEPTAPVAVTYPSLPGATLSPRPDFRGGAALVLQADRLYATVQGEVIAYSLRFGTADAGREVARYPGYDHVVGPLASGAVVVEGQAEATQRTYAVVEGNGRVRSGTVVSPGGPFIGPMAASPDGTRLAALYALGVGSGDEEGALAVYDLATGDLLASGRGGRIDLLQGARLHMVTDAGTLVYTESFRGIVGWDVETDTEVWSREATVEGRPFDPEGAQLAIWDRLGTALVIGADDGEQKGRGRGVFLEALPRGEYLVGLGDLEPASLGSSGVVVWDIALENVVRGRVAGGGLQAAAFDGETLVYVAGGGVERLPLRATWQAVD